MLRVLIESGNESRPIEHAQRGCVIVNVDDLGVHLHGAHLFPDVLGVSYGLSVAALELLGPRLGLFDPPLEVGGLLLEADPPEVPILGLHSDLAELGFQGLVLLGLAVQGLL